MARFHRSPINWTRMAVPVLGAFWLLVTTLPFLFVLSISLKSSQETYSSSVWDLPRQLYLRNYEVVLKGSFLVNLRNSLFVIGVSVGLVVLISAMAAFALARMRFRLNKPLFALIVAAMIVPVHITLVPIYLMTRNLGLYDTLLALIGPYVAFSLPVSIFILTEFMRQIPRPLEESATADGCGPFRLFWYVFFPLSRPGLTTVAIYNGIQLWNEFIFACVLTGSPRNRTLPLAVWDFQGQYASDIPAMLAMVTLSALPLIAAYAFGQERIVKGMMAGAVKG